MSRRERRRTAKDVAMPRAIASGVLALKGRRLEPCVCIGARREQPLHDVHGVEQA